MASECGVEIRKRRAELEAKILRRFSVRFTSARSLGAPQIPSPAKLCRAQEGDKFVRLYVRLMDLHSFRHNFCWQLIELGVPRLAILTALSCDDCRPPGMARRRSGKTSSNLIGLHFFLIRFNRTPRDRPPERGKWHAQPLCAISHC